MSYPFPHLGLIVVRRQRLGGIYLFADPGRRTGKSHLAAVSLLLSALNGEKGKTFYVAPTQGQARDVIWNTIFDIAGDIIEKSHVNNLEITLAGAS